MQDKPLRPRDAATLILLDRRGSETRVLMGRRSSRLAFEPGKFVFPGGRTDPQDSRVRIGAGLPDAEVARIAGQHARASAVRARAIALSALRETYEEAGILIGQRGAFSTRQAGWQAFAEHGVVPALDGLRLLARAITPTGQVRRFDTRFFATWASGIAATLPEGAPTQELEELCWLPIPEARALHLPVVTAMVLDDLAARLQADPDLRPGQPVPVYRFPRSRVMRTVI